MFNLGPEKILVILVIALVVLGPDKLPEAARKAGQVLGHLRRLSGGFEHEIRQALDEPMQAFNREFSAGEQSAPAETVAVGASATNGASGDASSAAAGKAVPSDGSGAAVSAPPADGATPAESAPAADGSVAAESAPAADGATPAESAPAADGASPEEPGVESSPSTTTADQPAAPPADDAAEPASTPSLPSWVFGRAGDDSGPAFH